MAETHIDDEVDFYALALESPLRWAADLGAAAADYNERLTFSLMEVYEVAAGLLDAQRDDRASALFAAFSSTSTLSLLLWRDPQGEAVSLPVAFKGPLSSMADLRRLAYSTDRLLVSPTLRAAGLIPDVVLFGASWNDVACVVGPARMVLICGSDVGQKAQLANSALRVS